MERRGHRRRVLRERTTASAEAAGGTARVRRAARVRRGTSVRRGTRVRRGTGVRRGAALRGARELHRREVARVEHRALAEVDRQLVVLVAVDEGARLVGDHAAEDRAAGEEPLRGLGDDAGRHLELHEVLRRVALGDERAALPNELVERLEALGAHAAAHVVGGVGIA